MAQKHGFGFAIYAIVTLSLAGYFAFAAVQGDLGVVSRVEAMAEYDRLAVKRDALSDQVAALTNKTRRLSDQYLDLDLLDERARDVLGTLRADDLVVR
ncbi:FtsB family cell division protein [Meridianimarinicoccus aquatilis]|uniref:Septum formation initiator family protein n=1 Tax=Meridianimarinicoccus aquatilis TaxID=2552766 RepID=A0A4R6AW68_9RHOB|nr:septum formation initiator family protein [Fluviibacterium aquatile]QIE41655.1 septum formation initiator family protein [Rhodobacteraceae bacterium SC52]TDL87992.1 septum formation initiator family protein [Fluviibacterium aquatile]